ncbi:MAG: EVE domain-containing protein [Chthoniobacterales bacterium]
MNVQENSASQMVNHWLVVTSPANFSHDREVLKFSMQGLPLRVRNSVQRMQIGDRVVYYIMGLQRFGATATITGEYLEASTKLWTDDDEMWPARRPSKADIVLEDDELVDAKKLVPNLSFVENKNNWGAHFQGSKISKPR